MPIVTDNAEEAEESGSNAQSDPAERPHGQKGPPTTPPSALPAGLSSDLIDEAPHAMWYVSPPSGEQYGPASANVLRSWIAEGRVTSNCHVWREGWEHWRNADVLLRPALSHASGPAVVVEPVGADAPRVVEAIRIDTEFRPSARARQRKRTLLLVYALLVLCLVLMIPLYLVTVGS